MKVYIVRHGQTPSNLAGVYNVLEEDLNDNGIEQAQNLGEKIRDLDLKKALIFIVSSPKVFRIL